MKSQLPLILGMMAVTYGPRAIPLFMFSDRPVHPLLRRFLSYIPYTALSALITHGIIDAAPELTFATMVSVGVAAGYSWLTGSLLPSVMISILAAYWVLV